ncbi:MAG: hypothetical protein ACLS61_17230 [Ruminococcus sp.]
MEKNRHTFLGQYFDDGTSQATAINAAVKKLQDKYGAEVFDLQKGFDDMGTVNIQFNADASTASEALNDFMNEMNIDSGTVW